MGIAERSAATDHVLLPNLHWLHGLQWRHGLPSLHGLRWRHGLPSLHGLHWRHGLPSLHGLRFFLSLRRGSFSGLLARRQGHSARTLRNPNILSKIAASVQSSSV